MRCCGGNSCSCKIEGGRNIEVSGSGSSQDPFVIASATSLTVEDSKTIDLGLTGAGTLSSPWTLTAAYAPTAELSDLPDVDASAPSNGQVLAWSSASSEWRAVAPAITAPGGILTDTSLDGDGSVGDPLEVRPDPARFLSITVDGLGLDDDGINRLVRPFPDAPTRAAADPPPVVGSISILATDPGRLDFWDGDSWEPITNGIQLAIQPGELLSLSGSYGGGTVIQYVAQLSVETGVAGEFEVISAADLTNYAGVLSVQVQPTGTTAWTVMVDTDTDRIVGVAHRADDGTPYAGFIVTAVVTALLY